MSVNKIAVAKFVARAIVGSGTTTITRSIIENNVQADTLPMRVSVAVASVVIGSMASQATRSHTDARIDEFLELVNGVKNDTEEPIASD